MTYRKEHVANLRDVAADYTVLQDLGLADSQKGRQLKARFQALRRNASTEEWLVARDGGRPSPPNAPGWAVPGAAGPPPPTKEEATVGLFSSKKKSDPAPPPPVRRDLVRTALQLGMTWYGGDPDGDDFEANRGRYYRALETCTPAEVDFVQAALERHGYPP